MHPNIPDSCLLEILDRVPLKSLLTSVPLVCHRWHQLVRPNAIARRSKLQLQLLTEKPYDKTRYSHSNLSWRIDNSELESKLKSRVDSVRRTFVGITSLEIWYRGGRNWLSFNTRGPPKISPSTIDLIASFSPRLVKLNLHAGLEAWPKELFHYINESMPQLRELSISFVNSKLEPLPVLKQLTHFKLIHEAVTLKELEPVVFKYLREGCERLVCCKLIGRIFNANWLALTPNRKVDKKITAMAGLDWNQNLNMRPIDLDYPTLKQLTRRFISLTWVSVHATAELTAVQILPCLSALTQLDKFDLEFDDNWLTITRTDETHVGANWKSLHNLQLPTVQHIVWKCCLTNHKKLHEWFNFGRLFPHLKTVIIKNMYWKACKVCRRKTVYECNQALCDLFSGGDHPDLKYVKIAGRKMFKNIETEWKL